MEAKRSPDACRQRMEARRESDAPLSPREEAQIEAAVGEKAEEERGYNLANGLGLYDPAALTRPPVPRARPMPIDCETAAKCITALDEHIGRNRTKHATVRMDEFPGAQAGNVQEMPLGELETYFPRLWSGTALEDALSVVPLYEFWEEWYASRPDKLRDRDGLEIPRANLLLTLREDLIGPRALVAAVKRDFFHATAAPARDFPNLTEGVLRWLAFIHLPEEAPGFLLDCLENLLSMVPPEDALGEEDVTNALSFPWQAGPPIASCVDLIRDIRHMRPDRWSEAHDIRLWHLLH